MVRYSGARFGPAPLAKHLFYLKRDGVTRNGAEAGMFDATPDVTAGRLFADRCANDRHDFRFMVSQEGGGELDDLRPFTRELMTDAEADLETRLDWVAVDHWDTDKPHVHLLIRSQADDGADLIIGRDYISGGLRERAAVLLLTTKPVLTRGRGYGSLSRGSLASGLLKVVFAPLEFSPYSTRCGSLPVRANC